MSKRKNWGCNFARCRQRNEANFWQKSTENILLCRVVHDWRSVVKGRRTWKEVTDTRNFLSVTRKSFMPSNQISCLSYSLSYCFHHIKFLTRFESSMCSWVSILIPFNWSEQEGKRRITISIKRRSRVKNSNLKRLQNSNPFEGLLSHVLLLRTWWQQDMRHLE
jgi:hypothetical protein